MVRIEVSSEIAERILKSDEAIEIYDDRGRRVGFFPRPITEQEIAEAKKRSGLQAGGSSLNEVWKRIHERDKTAS